MDNENIEKLGRDIPVMVTITEAVELTHVARFSLRELIAQGKIKAFRTGVGKNGKWLINLESLCDYLENPS